MKRIAVWVVLFLIHWVIAGLSAVGALSLLCLWNGDWMFLVWDYPGLSIGLLTGMFSGIMCMCAWGIRWRVLSRLPVED